MSAFCSIFDENHGKRMRLQGDSKQVIFVNLLIRNGIVRLHLSLVIGIICGNRLTTPLS